MLKKMMQSWGLLTLAFVLVLVPSFSQACSVCGCGDPLASSGSAHPLAGAWRIDFENIYLNASAASDNPAQFEHHHQLQPYE
jgi:hypothetical protein